MFVLKFTEVIIEADCLVSSALAEIPSASRVGDARHENSATQARTAGTKKTIFFRWDVVIPGREALKGRTSHGGICLVYLVNQ